MFENPIRELKKQKEMLQILPLKQKMFKKRSFIKFFYTNSDLVAFDMNKFSQIFIQILKNRYKMNKNDLNKARTNPDFLIYLEAAMQN